VTTRLFMRSGLALAALAALCPGAPAQEYGARAQAYALLASRLRGPGGTGLPVKCGLPGLASAVHARSALEAGPRAALGVLQGRQERQATLVTTDGLFKFHFDTTGIDAPAFLDTAGNRIPGTARAFADSAAVVMGRVYQVEILGLGYPMPPQDGTLGGGNEYDIYILNLGDLYGETTPDVFGPDGATSTTFIEIHNDFSFVTPKKNRGLPALEVTLAHEFHHAIQIGSYGFWPGDSWFHEITSVWMEDVVYHGVNDYLNYLFAPGSQFFSPGTPLTTANGGIEYSRGIFGKFMTKFYGRDVMRHVWENARSSSPLPALDATLRSLASPQSLSIAFADWTLWNYYTGPRADTANYYSEGALFPVMAQQYYDLISPSQSTSSSLSCLAAAYSGYVAGADTVTVALANVNSACPAGAQTSASYTLTVSRTKFDDTYRVIPDGLYMSLNVADQSSWVAWEIGRGGPVAGSAKEGSAFPNPFRTCAGSALYFPVDADAGTVVIYSAGMELVYNGFQQSAPRLGQRVLSWNGISNSGRQAPTGVYIFFLSLPGRTVTGKFALVRQ